MNAGIKKVVRALGRGYLGQVVADSRPTQTPLRFDPSPDNAATSTAPEKADRVPSVPPESSLEVSRDSEPRLVATPPRSRTDRKSRPAVSERLGAGEPVVRRIKAPPGHARSDSGRTSPGSYRQSPQSKSVLPVSRPRQRTTNYGTTRKGGGLKVENRSTFSGKPELNPNTRRTVPKGSHGSSNSLDSETAASGNEHSRIDHKAAQKPDNSSHDNSPDTFIRATSSAVKEPAPRVPKGEAKSLKPARVISVQPEAGSPVPIASPITDVVPNSERRSRPSRPGKNHDSGPRVEIGSVDVQVVMEGPEPGIKKTALKPQPYTGSSRASRLYQRRL